MHTLFYSLVVIPIWYVLRSDTFLLSRLFYANQLVGSLYFAFGMYQFLPGRRFSSAIMGLLASLLSQATMMGMLVIIGLFYA